MNPPSLEPNDRLDALIAADVREGLRRFPDDAFAAEARRRLAGRQPRQGFPGWRPRVLAAATVLLVAGSLLLFLSRRDSFRSAAPQTLVRALHSLEPSRAAPVAGGGGSWGLVLDRLVEDARGTAAAAADSPRGEPVGPGVAGMLKRHAVYHFLQRHASTIQEG